MNKSLIEEVYISKAKSFSEINSIENEFLIFDKFQEIQMSPNPQRLNCLLLGLCLQGKAQYSVDTEERLIQKNDTIIINEKQVIDNYMASPDFEGIAILISNSFINEVIRNIHDLSSLFLFTRNHPVVNLSAKEAELFVDYFELLKKKTKDENNYFRKDLVRSLLLAMVYDLSNIIRNMQQTNDKSQTRAETIFTNFIHLVENNFKKERRVSWYGEQLCITPKYLSETVKQVSKRTPNDWIDKFVTLEARVLLKNSTLSIKEIAQELNFPNQSFLGKYFKEHVGVSPTEYRKS